MNRLIIAAVALWLCPISATSAAETENTFHAHIVLFVQEGTDVPKNYVPRLQSLGLRTEAFFAKWMKHWGSPVERPEIFARNEDGKIRVTLVKDKVFNPGGGRAALPGSASRGTQDSG